MEAVDCGSLLPLSAMQPCCEPGCIGMAKPPDPSVSSAVDSRLSHGQRQQATAVHGVRRTADSATANTHPISQFFMRGSIEGGLDPTKTSCLSSYPSWSASSQAAVRCSLSRNSSPCLLDRHFLHLNGCRLAFLPKPLQPDLQVSQRVHEIHVGIIRRTVR